MTAVGGAQTVQQLKMEGLGTALITWRLQVRSSANDIPPPPPPPRGVPPRHVNGVRPVPGWVGLHHGRALPFVAACTIIHACNLQCVCCARTTRVLALETTGAFW